MWNVSRPEAVVVSIPSCRDRNPISRPLELGNRLDQVPERPAEPVQPPDDEHVLAVAPVLEASLELRSVPQRSRRGVGERLLTPRLFESMPA
jgi:hypothetical protein